MSTGAVHKDVGFIGYVGELQIRETSEDLVDKVLDAAKKDPWFLERLYALNDGTQVSALNTPSVELFQAALTDSQLSGDHQSRFLMCTCCLSIL